MQTTSRRLSQKYPEEMREFDRILDQLFPLIPKTDPQTLKADSGAAKLLARFHEGLWRSRKEFDALLFFTVCFGMLKSGKSTLVNLLAGHAEASPTRFGQDTTLRPCLLLTGEKDEIIIFRMKDSVKSDESEEPERKCFNAVIDHLRGVIEDEEELSTKHHVVVRREIFTQDNIIKALCTQEGFGIEPLITAVRLQNSSELLQSEIALLDVPGLDSDNMGTAIERYIELLDRCDLLLFIQSTVSALNHEAAGMLKKLVHRSKGSPVWLVQNRFEAQPWRKPEDLLEQDSKLTRVAREHLATALNIKERKIFAKQVNLGKAYDARFKEPLLKPGTTPEHLLSDSGFHEVENELSTKINDERLDIQLANCLNQLSDTVRHSRNHLLDLEKWIHSETEQLFEFRNAFDQLIEHFMAKSGFVPIPQNEDGSNQLLSVTKNLVKTHSDRWKEEVQSRMDLWKSEIQEDQVSDEFYAKLDTEVRNLFDRGPNEIFSLGSSFGSGLAEIFRRVVQSSASFRELVQSSQEAMAAYKVPLLESQFQDWNIGSEPRFLGVTVTPPDREKDKGKRGGFLWRKRFLQVQTCRQQIDSAATLLKEAVDRYVKKLESEELDKWFRHFRDDQLAEYYIGQIRGRKAEKERLASAAQKELGRIGGQLNPLRVTLDELENFAGSFRNKCNLTLN